MLKLSSSQEVLTSLCRWYFAMISMSGAFSVTFSVIFAYVADVTDERERSTAYGLVSSVLCIFKCVFTARMRLSR